MYYTDSTCERYFKNCPKCGARLPNCKMVLLIKANSYNKKNLTRLCENCYNELIEYLGIEDVDVD